MVGADNFSIRAVHSQWRLGRHTTLTIRKERLLWMNFLRYLRYLRYLRFCAPAVLRLSLPSVKPDEFVSMILSLSWARRLARIECLGEQCG